MYEGTIKGQGSRLKESKLLTQAHLCRVGSSTLTFGLVHFNVKSIWLDFILPCFIEIPFLDANSVDSDQTSRSMAFDPCLHC